MVPSGLFQTSFLLILDPTQVIGSQLDLKLWCDLKKKLFAGFTLFNFTAVQITFNSEGLSGLSHT